MTAAVPSVRGPEPLPDGPIVAYYGDDVSGSTDVMEALTLAGLPTALFFTPPAPGDRALEGLRAVGLAGTSRSRSPAWMDEHLPAAFAALRALGAPILHYKVCSTFDSAPEVGNIGRAIEIGQDLHGGRAVPVLVGAPALGRYVAFANLFATHALGDGAVRIDRHPVMSRHPSTPMDEADLCRHLARQTRREASSLDLLALSAPDAAARYRRLADGAAIVVLDTVDEATLCAAGRLLWAEAGPLFVVGSSGVEYALAAAWRKAGLIGPAPPAPSSRAVESIAVVSGSASPTSASQIEAARAAGFAEVAIDASALVRGEAEEEERAAEALSEALSRGASAIAHIALGPSDPRIAAAREALGASGLSGADSAAVLGTALGRILRSVHARAPLSRAVIAGGDTAAHAAEALGLTALTMVAPLVAGSPICRVGAGAEDVVGLELVMKGGQVGPARYYEMVRAGTTELDRGTGRNVA